MKNELKHINSLILDMDGVLSRGVQQIGDLESIFTRINNLGFNVALATNNSTLSAAQYQEKLLKFGVLLDARQIVNSSSATAFYLHKVYPSGGPVYIIGEEGLESTLEQSQFYHSFSNAQAVVVGLDRHLTYTKLKEATLLIRNGAEFYATNPDNTYPDPAGLVPGAGSILAAITAATEVSPHIIGKPSPEMYRVALSNMDASPTETLVVGDRLETDIAGGQELGCKTALVLSGVTSMEQAKNYSPIPDLIVDDLDEVIKHFE